MRTRCQVFSVFVALAYLVAWPVSIGAGPPPQEQVSENLLWGGDFESPPTWPMQEGVPEVQVAPGWRAYYLDTPPSYVQIPANCGETPRRTDCYWMRPEFRDNSIFGNRTRSGERSQKYFSFGRMHEAGLLQRVSGIPVGARVRFSIWMQAWMCANFDSCDRGTVSDAPSDMHLRAGIDPWGGTDPFTTTMVWSAELEAWDRWVLFQVETVALTDTVTVFTHSRPEWDWARNSNDVYLDDASLVVVGAYSTPTPTPTGGPDSPAPAPPRRTAAPSPTATPFPAGAVTYTVQMGDTLFGIALEHGVQVTDLLKLNQITISTQLRVMQPVVVRIVPVTPTPRPTPTPSASPTAWPTAVVAHEPVLITAEPVATDVPPPAVTPVPTSTPPPTEEMPRAITVTIMALVAMGLLMAFSDVLKRVVRR